MRGNPNFIASGWGEGTKPIKLPLRLCDRIQELRDQGLSCDDFLHRLADPSASCGDFGSARQILEDALGLRANAGGAIKDQIRLALDLLARAER